VTIGIVTGRPAVAAALRRALAQQPECDIVWTAANGVEALQCCGAKPPALVVLDMDTDGLDGVEATRQIMAGSPRAILIATDSLSRNTGRVFDAMGVGALDAVDIPAWDSAHLADGAALFLKKVGTLSRLLGHGAPVQGAAGVKTPQENGRHALVAVGASAGGPSALATLLGDLPHDFSAAVVIVQHVSDQFTAGMSQWLGHTSRLPVRMAREGDRPAPGTVLIAGTGEHLALTSVGCLGYTRNPRDGPYRPSVDVLFESVGRWWQGEVIGVLLTGMGSDGALGLKALRELGHHTIAQDQASSAVYGMPKAAAALHAAVDILPMERIAPRLVELLADRATRVRSLVRRK
jgi:two-component system response regulator WspF